MSVNRLRLGNLSIQDPLYLFPSSNISVYTDASGVHTARNRLQRGAGVYLLNGSLVRFTWPGNNQWITRHSHSTGMISIACLQGLISAIQQYGRSSYIIYCDNAGASCSFRKGSSKCAYSWTVLKALDDVASGTTFLVSITKTRRCSGIGETIADIIAKGSIGNLDSMGISSPSWLRPSRVLMDWIKKPFVTPSLGHDLLLEMSSYMDVVIPTSCTAAFEETSEIQDKCLQAVSICLLNISSLYSIIDL